MGKGGAPAGRRIVIELFADMTARMAENFRLLCTGEMGGKLHYKGSTFRFCGYSGICEAGGGIFTRKKLDRSAENFIKKHTGPGTVSVLPSLLGSSFHISALKALPHFDRHYVVVGQVVEGLDVAKAILMDDSGLIPIISDCGQLE